MRQNAICQPGRSILLRTTSSFLCTLLTDSMACRYCIALERRPFLTKACTSLVGFMLGDCLAQKLEGAAVFDFGRVLHLGAYGFFLDGPVGHTWYKCALHDGVRILSTV